MPRVLIIGFGNLLRGDDGFGFRAAQRLRETVHDPGVEILALPQLTPELMEPISRAGRVIFIDAAAAGEPGALSVTPLVEAVGGPSAFTHFATPGGLLCGARALYGAAPPAILVATAGVHFDLGEGLSAPVERALEFLLETGIRPLIAE